MNDVTDEQRADVQALAAYARSNSDTVVGARISRILAALPSELTNPQPVLPTEPGAYHDAHGTLTIIDPRGKWHGTYGDPINPELCPGPFTRLVPERPQVTREQLNRACLAEKVAAVNFRQARAILNFVNGTRA